MTNSNSSVVTVQGPPETMVTVDSLILLAGLIEPVSVIYSFSGIRVVVGAMEDVLFLDHTLREVPGVQVWSSILPA